MAIRIPKIKWFKKPVKRYEAICFVCGTEYMGTKRQKVCSPECRRNNIRSRGVEDKMIEHQMERDESDIHVCKIFTCNNHLSLSESLASDYCIKCNYDKQLKNKENIYQ